MSQQVRDDVWMMDQDNGGQSRKTPQWQKIVVRLAVLAAVLVFVLAITTAVLFGHTGPEPDFVEAGLLVPGPADDHEYIALSDEPGSDRFVPGMLCEVCQFPLFPRVSGRSSGPVYRTYSLVNTSDRYIAEVGWFNTTDQLQLAENELLEDLSSRGNVSVITLDLEGEFSESGTLPLIRNYPEISTQYTVTRFESNTTSGYFLVFENSLPKGGNAMVYCGTTGPSDLSAQSPHLRVLVFRIIDQSVIRFETVYQKQAGTWRVHELKMSQQV